MEYGVVELVGSERGCSEFEIDNNKDLMEGCRRPLLLKRVARIDGQSTDEQPAMGWKSELRGDESKGMQSGLSTPRENEEQYRRSK